VSIQFLPENTPNLIKEVGTKNCKYKGIEADLLIPLANSPG
jgi:hypothetical protein